MGLVGCHGPSPPSHQVGLMGKGAMPSFPGPRRRCLFWDPCKFTCIGGGSFLRLAPLPILGPQGDRKWIPREISCRSHLFSKIFDGFLKMVIFRSAIKSRFAYFFSFKRFSTNRQKVNLMAKTSGVKNLYRNFVSHSDRSYGMPIGAKTVNIFAKFRFFAFKVPRPPLGPTGYF